MEFCTPTLMSQTITECTAILFLFCKSLRSWHVKWKQEFFLVKIPVPNCLWPSIYRCRKAVPKQRITPTGKLDKFDKCQSIAEFENIRAAPEAITLIWRRRSFSPLTSVIIIIVPRRKLKKKTRLNVIDTKLESCYNVTRFCILTRKHQS